MTHLGNLYIVDAEGNQSDLNPIHTNHMSVTPGTIADLDMDGDFDIVTGYSSGITVVDIKSDKGTKTPWSIYRGNLARTAYYSDNIISSNDNSTDSASPQISLSNYPNPFNPTTTISFNLTKSQKVKLNIYNIKGQLVKNILNETIEKGNHQIKWNGKDSQNKSVGSGVYFIQLETSIKNVFRKTLLLK